eukprot:g4834.t1
MKLKDTGIGTSDELPRVDALHIASAFMGALETRGITSPNPSKRYIPVSSQDLGEALRSISRDQFADRPLLFMELYASTQLYFRFKLLQFKDELKSQYLRFNPEALRFDSGTWSLAKSQRDESLRGGHPRGVPGPEEAELLQNLHILADHANYDKLDDEWMERSLENPDRDGVSIKQMNRSDFTTLRVWVRGRSKGRKISTRSGFQKKIMDAYDLEIRSKEAEGEVMFERVLAAVRRSGDLQMRLMLFENVPTSQVELVMPEVEVEMQLKDKLIIGVLGGIGGITVAAKTLAMAMIGGTGNVYGVALAATICGGVCFQTWSQFHMKKTAFNHAISESLYTRKLAQNKIVIETLVHETEEQELRELMIGYILLLVEGVAVTPDVLKQRAERFLEDEFGLDSVQFDIDDCIAKLQDLQLAEMTTIVAAEDGDATVKEAGDDIDTAAVRLRAVEPAVGAERVRKRAMSLLKACYERGGC